MIDNASRLLPSVKQWPFASAKPYAAASRANDGFGCV